MPCVTQSQTYYVEPVKAYFGKTNCTDITAIADVAGSLNSQYFTFHSPASLVNSSYTAQSFYVWYNINALGVDPAVAGHTGIVVAAATGASASTIASLTVAAINASVAASAKVKARLGSAGEFCIENLYIGECTATADGAATTGFTFETAQVGSGVYLGSTSEDGSVLSTESESVEITSSQTGSLVNDEIFVGASASISMGIQETSKEKYELLLGSVTGGSFTPAGGSLVVGMGESKLFRSLFALGGRLIMKPIGTDSDDSSRNITFFKTAPKLNEINYNAETQVAQFEFVCYLDRSINSAVNYWMMGDSEQKGLGA